MSIRNDMEPILLYFLLTNCFYLLPQIKQKYLNVLDLSLMIKAPLSLQLYCLLKSLHNEFNGLYFQKNKLEKNI